MGASAEDILKGSPRLLSRGAASGPGDFLEFGNKLRCKSKSKSSAKFYAGDRSGPAPYAFGTVRANAMTELARDDRIILQLVLSLLHLDEL